MCGICGFVLDRSAAPDVLRERLGRMARVLRHRGPDDLGVWTDGRVGFGHTRLSVIDLSRAGHQPMSDGEGRVWISYNGEIYNFLDLRQELEARGASFVSRTDTEVILRGYQEWGLEVLDRLRGMFAFALWDADAEQLVLARDRVGKKPLFYATQDGHLFFASEPKAILAWPGARREPDYAALHHYLTLQYVPAPHTAFRGMSVLPPGHRLMMKLGGSPRIERYHDLPPPREAQQKPAKVLEREFIDRLDEATRVRMIADVPLGAFLSGGVDSSAVVAFMARNSSDRVRTFSIGFESEGYDERHYARIVAQLYGTEHTELVVQPDSVALVPKLAWFYNQPFADSSAIPTFCVSELARSAVTVALNGDGGDESFLGYPRYAASRKYDWASQVPYGLRRAAGRLAALLPTGLDRSPRGRKLRRILEKAAYRRSQHYEPAIAYFSQADKEAAYSAEFRYLLSESSLDLLEKYLAQAPSMLAGAAWADLHTYLPDDLLVKVDIASMAHSLEARSPLLDQDLMTWAAGIPSHQKMRGNQLKGLMKAALEPYLPKEVIYRTKMGFGVPIDHWIRGEMNELARDCLTSARATSRKIFEPRYAQTILSEHCDGRNSHHTRIWAMIMLEVWFRMWIDTPDPIRSYGHFSDPTSRDLPGSNTPI